MVSYSIEVPVKYRDRFYEYCDQNSVGYNPYAGDPRYRHTGVPGKYNFFFCTFNADEMPEEFRSLCVLDSNNFLIFVGDDAANYHIINKQIASDEDIVSKVVKNLYGDTTIDVGLYADIRDAVKESIKILTSSDSLL